MAYLCTINGHNKLTTPPDNKATAPTTTRVTEFTLAPPVFVSGLDPPVPLGVEVPPAPVELGEFELMLTPDGTV